MILCIAMLEFWTGLNQLRFNLLAFVFIRTTKLLTLYLQSVLYRDFLLFFHKQAAITLAEAFKMQTTRYNMLLLVVLFHLWECCPYLVSLVMIMKKVAVLKEWGLRNKPRRRSNTMATICTNKCLLKLLLVSQIFEVTMSECLPGWQPKGPPQKHTHTHKQT